ncbi:MAG TPA: hypothetical protein GXX34_03615 [Clostridia bacterium]|nr:hypothetical protein [Clostridia bacterium]
MLAAKKLEEAPYLPSTPSPEQSREERLRPHAKPRVKPRFYKFLYVVTVVTMFCCGLYSCSLAMAVATKGYEIAKLKSEIGELETANARLRLEIAKLDSLERIEMLALNEFGMVQPDKDDYMLLPGAGFLERAGEKQEVEIAEGGEAAAAAASVDDRPLFRQKAAALLAVALGRD